MLTVDLARNLKVIVTESLVTIKTGEAVRVELLVLLSFEVWSLNTSIAVSAQRVVQLVVMVLTVGVVVDDIEVGGGKRRVTGLADETLLMVASCQSAIGSLD